MDEKVLRRLKALSNENRLAILEYLRRRAELPDPDGPCRRMDCRSPARGRKTQRRRLGLLR